MFRNLANVFGSFAGNPLEERTFNSLLKWQIKEIPANCGRKFPAEFQVSS